jgi:hypothetical protein
MCFEGHVPTSMDEWEGRVVLGMMVCAPKVYAPVCIRDKTLVIFDAVIASGRRPSKLTINTRWNLGAGVAVTVGRCVSVGGGRGVLTGLGVVVGSGTAVGGVGVERNPHESRKAPRRVKRKIRRIISGGGLRQPTTQM